VALKSTVVLGAAWLVAWLLRGRTHPFAALPTVPRNVDGKAKDTGLVKGAGLGMDEQAMLAIEQWKPRITLA
jgi:hypothetical protein